MFSIFISTTDKIIFQTGRALAGIIVNNVYSAIVWNSNLPCLIHFIQIVLPFFYKYKDVQMYMTFFHYQLNYWQFQVILGGKKDGIEIEILPVTAWIEEHYEQIIAIF